ncbi:hypothetical protein DH2020_012411 [Rehmannia glutinosa]|uniref:Reverse transcriptase Ty1/copia-type domain-containing protein n=1 Tax=Rehmannia glutinosa TaxID=99300 RepID=A0ABR0X2D8_REHGL
MDDEYNALMSNNTWELVLFSENMNLITSKWIFRTKFKSDGTVERLKARLVARGFQQNAGVDFFDTFSPVVKPLTIRIMFSLAITRGWKIHQVDVNNAFLKGNLKEHSHGNFLMILVYVDDILIIGDSQAEILQVITTLDAKFSLKNLGEVSYFLGLEVHRISHGIILNQTKYISDLLAKASMANCKPCHTPCCPSIKLSLHDSPAFEHPSLYRSLIGALQYLTMTRPDISFAVNKLSQFLHSPTINHWKACKRVLRFLHGTKHLGLLFKPVSRMALEGFADADWASCIDDRRSTSGYCIFLGGNLITWSSKKQHVVARSSTESEYRSLALATTELVWIRSLFQELGIHLHGPSTLWCDNVGAITLASNPTFHARTKHIEIDVHFIREKVQQKEVEVQFVPSEDQPADLLTKPMSPARFETLSKKLCLCPSPRAQLA